jgi:predicted RNA-binding protein with RPS1 domain
LPTRIYLELKLTKDKRQTTTRNRKRSRGQDPASGDALAQCAINDAKRSKNRMGNEKQERPKSASKARYGEVRSGSQSTKHSLLDTSQLEEIANMDRGALDLLISGAGPAKPPKSGETVKGKIASVGEAVLVSLKGKYEGVIDRDELTDHEGVMSLKVGDEVSAVVLGWDGGVLRLCAQLKGNDVNSHITTALESGLPVEGKVIKAINGGFHVDIGGTRAFCPVSHIDRNSDAPPEAYVEQKFMFRIIEAKENDVVVSRRELLDELAEKEAGESWSKLQVDQIHTGTVRNITKFGAFVDLGGIEGLIHISEISDERVDDVHKHLEPGQLVTVKILGVDPIAKRLSLTLRGAAPKLQGLSTPDESNKGGLGTLGDLLKGLDSGSNKMADLFKDLK